TSSSPCEARASLRLICRAAQRSLSPKPLYAPRGFSRQGSHWDFRGERPLSKTCSCEEAFWTVRHGSHVVRTHFVTPFTPGPPGFNWPRLARILRIRLNSGV